MGIKLAAASGGSVELVPTNTASNFTVTVPAVTASVLTDSAGILNIGSGQVYKDASGNVGIGTSTPNTYGKFGVVSGANYFGVATDVFTSAVFGPRPANDGFCSVLFKYASIGTGGSFWKIDASSGGLTILSPTTSALACFSDGSASLGAGAAGAGAWSILGANNSGGSYPVLGQAGVGTTVAWNFTSGGRESSFMNNDTSGGGFRFVQRTGAASNNFLGRTNGAGIWEQGNNSATWTVTSDIRVKQNVRPLNESLAKITALNPCHFEYKNTPDKIKTGFIAQEFEQVLPGHVYEAKPDILFAEYFEEGEKMKSIDSDLIPYLVGAIKEQQALITSLTERITALEAK